MDVTWLQKTLVKAYCGYRLKDNNFPMAFMKVVLFRTLTTVCEASMAMWSSCQSYLWCALAKQVSCNVG